VSQGRVRGNLMGKRVDFSARCVITPDAYFDCDRVGVPYEIAKGLTVPETVNPTNIRALSHRVRLGADNVHGAESVVHLDGTVTYLKHCADRDAVVLQPGETVERFLSDDDVVVFNRQPSLHMHGMQCHKVRLMPGHTFRLSLPVATPYNADFDGDEVRAPWNSRAARGIPPEFSLSVCVADEPARAAVAHRAGRVRDAHGRRAKRRRRAGQQAGHGPRAGHAARAPPAHAARDAV
jgi:hypothetical protein